MEYIERAVDGHGHPGPKHRTPSTVSAPHANIGVGIQSDEIPEESDDDDDSDDTNSLEPKIERNDDMNPYWIEDKDLKKGPVAFLSANELQFWKELVEKYLYPIDADKVEEARIASDLKDLRDRSVFTFFMLNALFVVIVFLLQLNKDMLHVKWPFGVKTNITYDETTQEVLISKEYLQLEPIGLVFVFFFAFILIIQFTAMIFHRFGTLSHILASTELNWFRKKKDDLTQDGILDKQAVDIVRHLQRLKGINGDYENDSGSSGDRNVGRRRTIYNLEKQKHKTRTIGTLDVAFRKRFLQMKMEGDGEAGNDTPVLGRKLTMRREVREALEVRRKSLQAERRKSQMQTLGANNGFVNNVTRNHRLSSSAGVNVKDIFGGHQNPSYEHDESPSEHNLVRLQSLPRNTVNWAEMERNNN